MKALIKDSTVAQAMEELARKTLFNTKARNAAEPEQLDLAKDVVRLANSFKKMDNKAQERHARLRAYKEARQLSQLAEAREHERMLSLSVMDARMAWEREYSS